MILSAKMYNNLFLLVLIFEAVPPLLKARASNSNGVAACTNTPNGSRGQCVEIKLCPKLNNLLKEIQNNRAPPGSLDVLRKSICQAVPVMLVCCEVETRTPVPSLQVAECGKSSIGQRIVGGVNAKLFAWPWMALIQAKTGGSKVTFTCGGVLISDRYVLTAAHCTNKNPIQKDLHILFVRLGEHDLSGSPDCNQFKRCANPHYDSFVDDVIAHPGYRKDCRGCHDIALIRLALPITPDLSGIFPICLPSNFENQLQVNPADIQKSNRLAWIAGWGSVNKDPFQFERPNILQEAEIPFGVTDWCTTKLSSYPDPESVFCSGASSIESADTCRGDSGGPIMMSGKNTNNENIWYVIGIVSRGPTVCGLQGTQSIYTNVTHYLPWISENMKP